MNRLTTRPTRRSLTTRQQFTAVVAFDDATQISVTGYAFDFDQVTTAIAAEVASFISAAALILPAHCFIVHGREVYQYTGADEILDQLAIDA